ncbi:MFS transporter [Sansalvadorimonas sp. 2012CJ34-2]|uniref:MFS transporter n=1 Tax=Parendozoicomonas callyspongiae TaxID=2942213 RepID=A0ABT0PJE1_9GAMM|nr:MFS transporter [Sansalvadorimonas sp. 2012CJ34-2]MCL6271448.1 MFS transporter [Sansalvadorimonas sp. 2012CJ34-2]
MQSAKSDPLPNQPARRSSGLRVFGSALISILTLLLLVYAGYGETLLTYKKLEQEQASAQAGLVQSSIESALQSGIPLSDISGIDRLVQSTLLSLPAVSGVTVLDTAGRQVYPRSFENALLDISTMSSMQSHTMTEDEQVIEINLPLKSRLETEGFLQIALSKPYIEQTVQQIFTPLFIIAMVLAGLALPATWLLARSPLTRFWQEQGWFTFSFTAMSLVLVMVLTGLYIQSAGHRVEQVNDSLVARLSIADSHGIPLHLLSGIDSLLQEYQVLNPELETVTLSQNGFVQYSSDPELLYSQPVRDFYQLSDSSVLSNSGLRLTTTMPFSQVVFQVLRAGKNFAILYLTTLLLSLLFNRLVRQPGRKQAARNGTLADRSLEILRPLFFIAVFMESLHTALLPELLNKAATSAGLGTGLTSTLFMLYFLSFALTLLPGNRLCKSLGNRKVMLVGFVMAAAGSFSLAFGFSGSSTLSPTLGLVIFARVLAGIGQSLLMVAVQNEILANTNISNRTSGASIIVSSFNGGFICGTALGALLASYVGATGVFIISGLSGIFALLLAVLMVTTGVGSAGSEPNNIAGEMQKMKALLKHRDFLGTMLCIGIPAKATLTGIVTFALPLVMTQAGFASEDIGQIIICYAIAVLLATRVLAPRIDRHGNTRSVLVSAMLFSGIAVLVTAGGLLLAAEEGQRLPGALTMLAGVFLLGLSHGGINAPVVSHVTSVVDDKTASQQSTVTFYRFLERFGHVLGPLLVGQILILAASGQQALLWLAIGLMMLALMFYLLSRSTQPEDRPVDKGGLGSKVKEAQ